MTMKISHQPISYKIVRIYTADTAHILMITYPNCSSKQITSCTPSMPWALVKSRIFLNSNCLRNSAQLAKSASGLNCALVTLTNRVAITVDTRKIFIIIYLRAHLRLSLLHRFLLGFISANLATLPHIICACACGLHTLLFTWTNKFSQIK